MLKIISLILIISLCGIKLEIHAAKESRFINQWTRQAENFPHALKLNNHLVTVSWRNNNSLYLQYEPDSNIEPCEIPVTIGEGKEATLRLWARAFGNGKIIVATNLVRNKLRALDLYIVMDPVECTGKAMEVPREDWINLRIAVPYYDIFDLFPVTLPGRDKFSPVTRYSDKAEPIDMPPSVDPHVQLSGSRVRVFAIKPEDPSEGYIAVTNSLKDTSLSLLNTELVLKTKIDRQGEYVFSCSTSFGRISSCYSKQKRLVCEFLDEELKAKLEIPMMYEDKGSLWNAYVSNLPDGGAMVLVQYNFVQKKIEDPMMEVLYAQRIFSNGTTSEPLEIQRHNNPQWSRGTYPHEILMDNGEYCVAIVEVERIKEIFGFLTFVNVKCIDTSN